MSTDKLPEPDFVLDQGNAPCYYESTLRAALAAQARELERVQAEVERQRDVISKVNARCDHLGMRLGEVIKERDALRAEVERLDWIECRAMNGQIQIARSLMRTGYEVAVLKDNGPTVVKVYTGTLRAAIDAARAAKGQTP